MFCRKTPPVSRQTPPFTLLLLLLLTVICHSPSLSAPNSSPFEHFRRLTAAAAAFIFMALTTFLSSIILVLISGFVIQAAAIGVNYGQIANNLPPPQNVIPLVKSIGVTRLKLYDADCHVLRAFAGTGIEFIVGLGNEYLPKMKDPQNAIDWVKSNVQIYLPKTKITTITVGNEVLTFNDTSLSYCLMPAMRSIQAALVTLGLDKQVTVTTPNSLATLETSYPPSSGAFRKDLVPFIREILKFHAEHGSPFLVNAYPYFAYKANPKQVEIEFVLFQPSKGIFDPVTSLHYDNMLYAQIDAVYHALASVGFDKTPVQISETGWPSKGDDDEPGATLENAKKYNGNLVKIINQKKGTPMKPDSDLNVFVFALFNENLKPGPTSERNYGLFKPDGMPAYSIGVSNVNSSGNGNSSSGGGNNGFNNNPGFVPTPPFGFDITSGMGRSYHAGHAVLAVCLSFCFLCLIY